MSDSSYILPMKSCLSLFAVLLSFQAWAQFTPDTVCTLNCAHPGYRSITQEVGGETLLREYIPVSYTHLTLPTTPYV